MESLGFFQNDCGVIHTNQPFLNRCEVLFGHKHTSNSKSKKFSTMDLRTDSKANIARIPRYTGTSGGYIIGVYSSENVEIQIPSILINVGCGGLRYTYC